MLADIIIVILIVYVMLNIGSLYSEIADKRIKRLNSEKKQRDKGMGL